MPSVVKSIALVTGTGIAMGLYMTAAGAPRRKPEGSADPDSLPIEPLLDRMEQLEGQFAKAGLNGGETRILQLHQEIASLLEAKAGAAERIGALERAMADQLKFIDALRDRAVESDANLQRLVAVVGRLSERPVPPSPTVLPFEAQLAEAVQRDVPGETRVRVIKEGESERRHRFPLGRTFAFLLAAILPGFHR
jgi:uncharacterized coiled-coil protein SlyX